MRLLNLGPCFVILSLSLGLWVVAQAIGTDVRADAPPVWTRSCTVSVQGQQATLHCGKYVGNPQTVPRPLALAIASPGKLLVCSAFRVRTTSNRDVDVSCETK